MRSVYALLGLVSLIVFLGAYMFIGRVHVPQQSEVSDVPLSENQFSMQSESFTLTSPEFEEGAFIPKQYTCDGDNVSPSLHISHVPPGTQSLVLIMDDPDVPKERRPEGYFDHLVLYNIDPQITVFEAGSLRGTFGQNGRGAEAYTGPCPPPEFQPTTHRYFFKLYAIDLPSLVFPSIPTKHEVLAAIEGHVLGEATLMGRYDRTKQE